jgi:hypothetical protein
VPAPAALVADDELAWAIAKALVEAHDGHIDAHSAGPGSATTINISLPIRSHLPSRPRPARSGLNTAAEPSER